MSGISANFFICFVYSSSFPVLLSVLDIPPTCSTCLHPALCLRLHHLDLLALQPKGILLKEIQWWRKNKKKYWRFNLLGSLLALLQGSSGPPSSPEATVPVTRPSPAAAVFPNPGTTARLLGSSGLRWQRLPAAWVPGCFTVPLLLPVNPHISINSFSIKLSSITTSHEWPISWRPPPTQQARKHGPCFLYWNGLIFSSLYSPAFNFTFVWSFTKQQHAIPIKHMFSPTALQKQA